MVSIRPAFSAAFADSGLTKLAPLGFVAGMNPVWAWEGSCGERVKVAVIDSGIDATHPDVGPIQGYVSITEGADGEICYDNEPHVDSFGHATACAGVIRSLAPVCDLFSVQVLENRSTADHRMPGAGLTCSGRVLVAALRWAIDSGMHVCNISVGTTKREFFALLHELADLAYFGNVTLVSAANNSPIPSFPSAYASVISVASHAISDPYTIYYNPRPPAEFGALGIDVRLAWVEHKHITASGNSFAAAHMTGLVTKILGKNPGLTPFQLKTILRELAANVESSQTAESRPWQGGERQRGDTTSDKTGSADEHRSPFGTALARPTDAPDWTTPPPSGK